MLINRFKNHIQESFPELLHKKVLLAVSGGVDSMVLLHLCKELTLDIAVAHCNFQLRGADSDADETLVINYCEENHIPFYKIAFDTETYAQTNKKSIQIAARELRYNWFKQICTDNDYHFIATAHHLDDQVETFLINFTRGTGIDGLMGIPEKNENIVRPLLIFSRDEILSYAKQHQINWREDTSNASTKYLRNKLRHLVVPILKQQNTQFLKSFQNTLTHLHETQFLASQSLKNFEEKCVIKKDDHFIISLEKAYSFKGYKYYLTHFLRKFEFASVLEIEKILQTHSGKVLKNDKFKLLKNRNEIIIYKNKSIEKHEYHISTVKDFLKLPIKLKVEEVLSIIADSDKNTIFVDYNLLKFPMILRRVQLGDVFQPFGMTGMKKVSKFFKDEKQSQLQKEHSWILVNGDGKIIWIVGLRADDRFKVTKNNQNIYKITLQK